HAMRSSTRGAISLRRVAMRASGDEPLMVRSSAKMASNFRTASKAIGEIVAGFCLRAFAAISASSNSLRRASGFRDRSRLSPRLVELIEPSIGVGLQDPAIAGEMLLGVDAGPIGRVE